MRITAVEPLLLQTAWRDLVLVQVETDEGVTGVGEVRIVNHPSALLGYLADAIDRYVIGTDPFRTTDLVTRMVRDEYVLPGEIGMSAISLIEIACWDIVGRSLGVPVHRLLGGEVRTAIPTYANGWYTVDRTPEAFADAATAAMQGGYAGLKLDPFGAAWQRLSRAELREAVALVEAVRGAIGPDAELLIEMHGRFGEADAVRAARALAPFEPGWIEEPVPPGDATALARVAARVDMPVAAGERLHHRHEFRELFERRAVTVVQPDVSQCGGLGEALRIGAWAESYGIDMAPHNVGGPVSTAAALHLAAVLPNFRLQEHFVTTAEPLVAESASGLPARSDGAFALPGGPGLGVALDRAAIDRAPRRSTRFNLFQPDWHRRGP
jgi:galactonate dehydratase